MINDDDITQAIDRIARTQDGELLYRHLQKILCGVVRGAPDHTLREHVGRQILASDLMGLMAKGIDESGGRTSTSSDATGSSASERPVVFAPRAHVEPRTIQRGPARRGIDPGDPELADYYAARKA